MDTNKDIGNRNFFSDFIDCFKSAYFLFAVIIALLFWILTSSGSQLLKIQDAENSSRIIISSFIIIFSFISIFLFNRIKLMNLSSDKAWQTASLPKGVLAKIFRAIPDSIAIISLRDGIFIEVNEESHKVLGYEREELIGHSDFRLGLWPKPEQRKNLIERFYDDKKVDNFQVKLRAKNGDMRDMLLSAELFDIDNETCMLIAGRDITEQKRAEKESHQIHELLSTFVEYTPAAVAMFDKELCYLAYSKRWIKDYKLDSDDIRGQSHYDIFPDLPERWKLDHKMALSGKTLRFDDEQFPRLDGSLVWMKREYHPWYDTNGEVGGIIMFNEVTTERRRTEQALLSSEERFRALYDNNPLMLFTLDKEGLILSVNRYGISHLGYSEEELIGKSVLKVFYEEDRHSIVGSLRKCFDETRDVHKWEVRKICCDGSVIWVRETVRVVTDMNAAPIALVVCEDITERKYAEEQLSYQASHDALTGLVNRREFERRAERLLATVKEDKAEHALCFMDLDQFKVINDTCGHTAGDELLRQLSSLLSHTVRHRDTLARLGGDEFGVLMEHCPLEDAHRVASSVLSAINGFQFRWEGRSFKVGVCIGLVSVTEASGSITQLLSDADAACYMAKEKGRNRIHVYHSEDVEMAQRYGEMQWVTRLNHALEENRFCMYAQAIAPLDGSADKHYELLIRMLDEEGNIIPPGIFLPAAERYSLIINLDRWVIKNAFNLLATNSGFVSGVDFCSINLSGQSLTSPEILEFIIHQLNETGVQGEKICFEITETAAISNLSTAIKFISTLKDLGCRFALDDFGSGLSSFGYLKNLPVDYLKIDGMFVKDIVDDPIDRAMVKSINEIGHVMGMKTIAEFVENDEIKNMLKLIEVNFAQGYAIGKPQPLSELFDRPSNVIEIKQVSAD